MDAEFDPNWCDLSFSVRKEFLLRLLDAGHRKLEINDTYGPIVGTGGTGMYIVMPLRPTSVQAQSEQKQEQNASAQTDVNPEVQTEQREPQNIPETTESTQIPNTTQNKEKPTKTPSPVPCLLPCRLSPRTMNLQIRSTN